MAKKISDIQLDLAYRLGEASAPDDPLEKARRLSWFVKGIDIVAGGDELMWFMQRLATDRTVADQEAYTEPTKLKQYTQIKVDGYKYSEVSFDEVYRRFELPTSPVAILPSFVARSFYQWNGEYHLIPSPGQTPTIFTVSSITSVATVCTCTTAVAHKYQTGQYVEISGANETAYNGTFKVTVTSSTTFTYTALSTPSATPATGTITAQEKNILIWYYSYPTEPTDENSSIVIPDNYSDVLVSYAEGRYWSFAHKRAKSADAFTEFQELLDRIKKENFRRKFLAT